MSRNEALAHIEKANHDTGIEAAYSALNDEVTRINSGTDPKEAAAQLAELEAGLKRDKLLPDLAVMWAVKNRGLYGDDDRTSLNDLDEYRNRLTTDAMSKAMATSLMEQHAKLRDNWWADFDGVNLSKEDIDEAKKHIDQRHPDMLRTETYAKFADQLKDSDFALFKKLSGGDTDKTNVTARDLKLALEANAKAKKFDQAFLTDEEVETIKEVRRSMTGSYIETPYLDSKNSSFTADILKSLPARQKGEWELEDAPAAAPVEADVSIQKKGKDNADAAAESHDKTLEDGIGAGAAIGAAIGKTAAALLTAAKDELNAPEQISKYYIEAGQGFDRIARDVLRREALRKDGRKFNEADVIALSSQIAEFNNMKRQDVLRLDQKSLNIPPLNWDQISAS